MRTWWKRCTLRVRLATWYAVVGSLLLALFSALLYFFVAHSMARPLDYQLRGDLSVVRARLGVQSDGGLLLGRPENHRRSALGCTQPVV